MTKVTKKMWREFEKIAYTIIESELQIKLDNDSDKILVGTLTSPRNDGGYDGIFIIKNKGLTEYSKILFEAKLRGNVKKDLPLFDISKSMIIAFNSNAKTIIIATNLHLSDGTRKELKKFGHKSNLKIKYLTPNAIHSWIQNESDDFYKKNQSLIALIKDSVKENLENKIEEITSEILEKTKLQKIIRNYWETLLDNLGAYCCKNNGLILIEGNAGSGKSFFIQHLANKLLENSIFVERIDLKGIYSSHTLFIKILSVFWNIPFENLIKFSEDDINDIAISVSEEKLEQENIKKILYSLDGKNIERITDKEILNHVLLEYLEKIYAIREMHSRIVLSFSNLNNTSSEVLDFLLNFTNRFDIKMPIIIELRTSIYIDKIMTEEEWNNYLIDFQSIRTYPRRIVIKDFENEEAFQFVKYHLECDDTDRKLTKSIIKKSGNNPLIMDSLLKFIKIDMLDRCPSKVVLCQEIEKMNIDDQHQIFSNLIHKICSISEKNIFILEILRLLNGEASKNFVEKIIPDIEDKLNFLENINLIYIKDDIIYLQHVLYLNILDAENYISNNERRNIAQKILDNYSNLYLSDMEKNMILVKIYDILRNHEKNVLLSSQIGKNLFVSGNYGLSRYYCKHALDCFYYLPVTDELILLETEMKLCLVQVSTFIKKDSLDDAKLYMNDLANIFESEDKKYSNKELAAEYQRQKCNYYLIKNRWYHSYGDFETAFLTILDGLKYVMNDSVKLPVRLVTNTMLEYGIALKEKRGFKHSIHALKVFMRKYPEDISLKFTFNTQNYELNLMSCPEEANKYVVDNDHIIDKLGVSTRYHNKVHKLNVLFFEKDYDKVFNNSLELFEETTKIQLFKEAGRLANLLGNIYLIKGQYKESRKYYDYGINIYNGDSYISFLWPIILNRITLYSMDTKEKTFDMIKDIEHLYNIFSHHYINHIEDIFIYHKSKVRYDQLKYATIYLYNILKNTKWDAESIKTAEILKENFENRFLNIKKYPVESLSLKANYYHNGKFLLV